jgi:hypothetical protein
MRTIGIAIEADENGKPVIKFRKEGDELSPPATLRQRVSWIREAYDRFDANVRERRAVVQGLTVD